MAEGEALSCPVCRARFRGSRACSRCGADLGPLMSLAAKAFVARRGSVRALAQGDFVRAGELSAQAQALHETPRGRRLLAVSALLAKLGGRVSFPPVPG